MKKLIFIISLFSLWAGALDASARYKGDLNGDDRVDLADMVYLAKAIKAGSTDKALDVNASGKVDDYDLQKLADIIISGKLTEDSGMNVGIGGWDDTGEDFGGTVKAPAFNTRSGEETRFYMRNPKSEGADNYSMEFGISEGSEAPCAILFNIRLPREMKFDQSKMIELDQAIASSHKLYGTPKFKKENEEDEWSEYALCFIVMSPDLSLLPISNGKLGTIHYTVSDCWGSPTFSNCQTVGSNSDECTYLEEHWGGYDGNFKPVEVSSVWFDQSEMYLTAGDEGWLYANIDPWDATDQNLVWSSSDESVATVFSEDGRNATIKALKAGEAVISASASNGMTATCAVNVEARFVDVNGIFLNQENINITEGDVVSLTATIDPADATDQTITWSSSNEGVAVVDGNGLEATVTALAEGYVEIFASASNGMTAICAVNVAAKIIEASEIVLSASNAELKVGETVTLSATVLPEDTTDKTVVWTSDNEAVATVDANGNVTANALGEATVTATCGNVSATCNVIVVPTPVESISISDAALDLIEGETVTLTAILTPEDATDKTVTWTSSDESVATVSAEGVVTAIKAGTATITAASSNGLTATCIVNVAAKIIEATEIVLSASNSELKVGESVSLSATVLPEDTSDKTVVWSSSNEEVATVDTNGNVTAIALGEATVTATCGNAAASCLVIVVPTPVESITLSNSSLSLTEGESATLTVVVNPSDATDKTVTWTSSDESVATVSAEGDVTAIKEGSATITATSSNGLTADCVVTVKSNIISVTAIAISNTELNLIEGETANLEASISPDNATDKTVTWTSSDEAVATVSAEGEVTAIKAGTATITAASSNGLTATCIVNVAAKIIEATEIVLSASNAELKVGESVSLSATVLPEDTTDKKVVWTSDNEAVATVDANGNVTAIGLGEATITATCGNASATCNVTVVPTPVESITLSNSSLTLTEGESATLTAVVNPSDATDKTVTWTSSDEAVATVSAEGVVTAVKAGSATITAASSNGLTATCVVNVAAKIIEATEIVLNASNAELKVGESMALTATVLPEDTTDKTVVWTSDNEAVASVDANGNVTAIGLGEATITATCGNASATCNVSVIPTPVESITLSNSSLTLTEGERATLTATVNPSDATDKTVTWSSSDESVATVSAEGEVTAIKEGTATITATSSNGLTADCVVTVNANIISVTAIAISNTELNLIEGETANLEASISPDNATDKTVTWTSSDESVATVSAEGEVTAIMAGTATITAASSNGLTATCVVNVAAKIIEATEIVLSASNAELKVGESMALTATVLPEDTTDKTVVWTTDNEAVATVDANGNVTAIGLGEATITATCGNASATCKVTVVPTPVESITLSNSSLTLTEGERATLTAVVNPSDATDKTVTWSSSDESVATVSTEGEVTAIKEGTATITASTSNGLTADCVVTVDANIIAVTEITISQSELTLIEGETATLTATVSPDDATDKTVTWTSSDESVATVSAEGGVTAIREGTAIITAASSNGLTATCQVTVEQLVIEMEAIILNAESLDLEVGDTFQLTAEIIPADATYQDLEWWVDDDAIATVDQNGMVTMLSEGETTVHVRSAYWNEVEASCHLNVSSAVAGLIEDKAPCDIYTYNGVLLKKSATLSDIDNLSPGIYIIRQGLKTTKLLK